MSINPRYFAQGDRAYKVTIYGGDDMDPSREIEPGSEHWGEDDALAEARQMLTKRIGHENGLWWSASVDQGSWVGYDDGNVDWIEWEPDRGIPSKWLALVDGEIVDQSD